MLKRNWRRVLILSATFIASFILLIGPWPVINPDWKNSDYARQTLQQIGELPASPSPYPVTAGVSSVKLNLQPGDPIGGFSHREERKATGSWDTLAMKAISFGQQTPQGEKIITIAGGDFLLPLPELIKRVVELTGIPRDHIFFTASHTHSGPGGYAKGYVEELTLGPFKEDALENMARTLSQAITESRKNMRPASLTASSHSVTAPVSTQFMHNYLQPETLVHDTLHLLQARSGDNVIATLVTFSAHPTLLGERNTQFSSDYPGVIQNKLQTEFKSPVMFMAGAMGAMMPNIEHPKAPVDTEYQDVQKLGTTISRLALKQIRTATSQTTDEAVIQSVLLPVKLPSPNYHLNEQLRASPAFVSMLFHDRTTYIHALRIGSVVMLSYPADFSGELAMEIEKRFATTEVIPWVISFNGDYIGYLNPSSRYRSRAYVTLSAEVYGKWGGDYMLSLGEKLIKKMHPAR